MRKCRVNMSGLCLKLGSQDDAGLRLYGHIDNPVRLVGSTQLDTPTCFSLFTDFSRVSVVALVYVSAKPPRLLEPGGSTLCLHNSLSLRVSSSMVRDTLRALVC